MNLYIEGVCSCGRGCCHLYLKSQDQLQDISRNGQGSVCMEKILKGQGGVEKNLEEYLKFAVWLRSTGTQ